MKKLLSLLAALLLALPAAAQSDKAQHLAVSTGLGLAIRAATDSKAAAFWSTVAIGAAKEISDSQQVGNRFDASDMAANLLGAGLATLGPPPDRVAAMGFSWHTQRTKHLQDFTPGLMLSWDAAWLPWERGAVDAAIFRNSQGFPGAYVGLSKEWRLSDRWYAGLGAGATYGYREYHEEGVLMYGSTERPDGIVYGCLPKVVCIVEVPGKPKWYPALLLSARAQLDHGFYVMVSYMPAGAIAKLVNGNNGFLRASDALSLWIGRSF